MVNRTCSDVLKEGVVAWNAWRDANPLVAITLSGVDLQSADLKRANLESADLRGANLGSADLQEANLSEADLIGADLEGANLEGCNLEGANLSKADLKGANLNGALLRQSKLDQADLRGASLIRAHLECADLGCSKLEQANFEGAVLAGASLADADARKADFGKSDLSYAKLIGSNLERARLEGANLNGAVFTRACLAAANLQAVSVDASTYLEDANVRDCTIDHYTLECLKDFGGLSVGARMHMNIINDVALLRMHFSGLQKWLHLSALFTFLFPYVAFLLTHYFQAKFYQSSNETIPLWIAILRYIWNGGEKWQIGWNFHWSFLIFIILCFYNVCRWLLLSKTIELEHRQEITGVPVPFVLQQQPFWHWLVTSMNYFFWIGLLILLFNTYHFLTQKIPVALD